VTLYAILGVILAAIAAVFGISRTITKAKDATAKAKDIANAEKLDAKDARHANERAADKVDQANQAVDEIDEARKAAEHRAAVLEEDRFNAPKIDPTDPRPGATGLLQAAGPEAVPGVRRDPGEDR
jgi:hypothetical protein